MVRVGSVPLRARLGRRARGLQRRRRRLGLVPARPRPLARVPLERGRHGRHDRRLQPAVAWRWRCGTARTRSSRSGCSGCPVPRATTARTSRTTGGTSTPIPSSAWLRWRYHYPQAAFPYEDLVDDQPRPVEVRARVRAARHRRLRRRSLLDRRGPLREGEPDRHPDADHGPQPGARGRRPSTSCRRCGSATNGPGTPTSVKPRAPRGPDGRSILATHPELGDYTLEVGPAPDGTAPTLLFCENETNRARIEGVPPTDAVPEGRHQRPRHRAAPRRSTRTAIGTKAAPGTG